MDTQNTGIDREELVDAFSSPKSGMVALEISWNIIWDIGWFGEWLVG